ncbi:hypothetical protein D3C80_1124880 [compost metagenome]
MNLYRLADVFFGEGAQGVADAQNALFRGGKTKLCLQHDYRLMKDIKRAGFFLFGGELARFSAKTQGRNQK